MKFKCEKYPELTVYCEEKMLQFHKGKFETDDKKEIAALKKTSDIDIIEEKE